MEGLLGSLSRCRAAVSVSAGEANGDVERGRARKRPRREDKGKGRGGDVRGAVVKSEETTVSAETKTDTETVLYFGSIVGVMCGTHPHLDASAPSAFIDWYDNWTADGKDNAFDRDPRAWWDEFWRPIAFGAWGRKATATFESTRLGKDVDSRVDVTLPDVVAVKRTLEDLMRMLDGKRTAALTSSVCWAPFATAAADDDGGVGGGDSTASATTQSCQLKYANGRADIVKCTDPKCTSAPKHLDAVSGYPRCSKCNRACVPCARLRADQESDACRSLRTSGLTCLAMLGTTLAEQAALDVLTVALQALNVPGRTESLRIYIVGTVDPYTLVRRIHADAVRRNVMRLLLSLDQHPLCSINHVQGDVLETVQLILSHLGSCAPPRFISPGPCIVSGTAIAPDGIPLWCCSSEYDAAAEDVLALLDNSKEATGDGSSVPHIPSSLVRGAGSLDLNNMNFTSQETKDIIDLAAAVKLEEIDHFITPVKMKMSDTEELAYIIRAE